MATYFAFIGEEVRPFVVDGLNDETEEAVAGRESEIVDESVQLIRARDVVAPREEDIRHATLAEPLDLLQVITQSNLPKHSMSTFITCKQRLYSFCEDMFIHFFLRSINPV